MFLFSLATPEKKLYTDIEVEEVVVPGHRGYLDILPGHAPLITTLSVGTLRFRKKGSAQFETAVVSWGYCEVSPMGVTILAETAESLEEINRERAEAALREAQKRLTDPNLEGDQVQKYQRKIKRALARIQASN